MDSELIRGAQDNAGKTTLLYRLKVRHLDGWRRMRGVNTDQDLDWRSGYDNTYYRIQR